MLVERSLHPKYLSNAYLVADEQGGAAFYVDSGAPLEPLQAAAAKWEVKPQAVLRTHSHADHVEHDGELGLPVKTDAVEIGGLQVEALSTPGHSDGERRSSSARSSSRAERRLCRERAIAPGSALGALLGGGVLFGGAVMP